MLLALINCSNLKAVLKEGCQQTTREAAEEASLSRSTIVNTLNTKWSVAKTGEPETRANGSKMVFIQKKFTRLA